MGKTCRFSSSLLSDGVPDEQTPALTDRSDKAVNQRAT
jgi:hypothetical protein